MLVWQIVHSRASASAVKILAADHKPNGSIASQYTCPPTLVQAETDRLGGLAQGSSWHLCASNAPGAAFMHAVIDSVFFSCKY